MADLAARAGRGGRGTARAGGVGVSDSLEAFPATSVCRYFLARRTVGMQVEIVDGCHDSPEGVAKAKKLHTRIFGEEDGWLMVEVHPIPDLDPPINEDAAASCAALVRGE